MFDGVPLVFRVIDAAGEIHVVARGRRWRFAEAAAPLIDKLVSGRSYTVTELITDDLPESTVRLFLRELAVNGLIVVV